MQSRRHLLAATVALAGSVAGCLSGHQGAANADDSATNATGSDVTGNEPVSVQNGGILELTFGDTVSPNAVRVEAGGEVSLTVTNNTPDRHRLTGPEVGLTDSLVIPAEVTKSTRWLMAERPGSGVLRCTDHDTTVVSVSIVPSDVSGGCPTG